MHYRDMIAGLKPVVFGAFTLGITLAAPALAQNDSDAKRVPYAKVPELALIDHLPNAQFTDIARQTQRRLNYDASKREARSPNLPESDELYLSCVSYGEKQPNTVLNQSLTDVTSGMMIVERGPIDANFVAGDIYGKGEEAFAVCHRALKAIASELEAQISSFNRRVGTGLPGERVSAVSALPYNVSADENLAVGAMVLRPFFVERYGIGTFRTLEQVYRPFDLESRDAAIVEIDYDPATGPVAGIRQIQVEDLEGMLKAAEYGRQFMAITDADKAAVNRDFREAQIDLGRAYTALNTLRLMNAMNFTSFDGNFVLEPAARNAVIKGPDFSTELIEITGADAAVFTAPIPGNPYPAQRDLTPNVITLDDAGKAVIAAIRILHEKELVWILAGAGRCPIVNSFGDCVPTVQSKANYDEQFSKLDFAPEIMSTASGGLKVKSGRGGLGPLILDTVFVTGETCTKDVDGRRQPRLLAGESITSPNICALVTHLEDRENMAYDAARNRWVVQASGSTSPS